MTTAGRKRVKFEFNGNPGSEVFVAGSFNNWSSTQAKLTDKKSDGTYATRLLLVPGRHEYKFIVDGTWGVDPKCSDSTPDGHGSMNSVVIVE